MIEDDSFDVIGIQPKKVLNSHIVPPSSVRLSEWFQHSHSIDEIKAKLNVGGNGRYEDFSDNHSIETTENADMYFSGPQIVTPYQKDKIKELKNSD